MRDINQPILLSGRPFTPDEIVLVCETVEACSGLAWHELLQTVCEHLNWVTPTGRYKVASCAHALTWLARGGRIRLPAKAPCRGRPERVVLGPETDSEAVLTGTVRTIAPVSVVPATAADERRRWNAYVTRYHPQGYRRPFGAHQRYFVVGAGDRRLGCVLFAASAWALAARDQWIGWSARDRAQRLHLIVANTRFVLFPWVRVKNLASTALSRVVKRIGADWHARYGYEPVLVETFVDPAQYRGTCYRAANWIRLGRTTGRGRLDREQRFLSTPREIYVYPLRPDWRSVLHGATDASIARSREGLEKGSEPGVRASAGPTECAGRGAEGHGHGGQ